MGFLDSLTQMLAGLFGGGNSRHYHDLLGLAPEEDFQAAFGCTLWREPTKAEDMEAAAMAVVGLFTGHAVQQTGVQAMAGITTTKRLVIGMIQGHEGEPLSFASDAGYQLVDTGDFTREKLMGPTGSREPGCILALRGPEGEVFQIFMAQSRAAEFAGWA